MAIAAAAKLSKALLRSRSAPSVVLEAWQMVGLACLAALLWEEALAKVGCSHPKVFPTRGLAAEIMSQCFNRLVRV